MTKTISNLMNITMENIETTSTLPAGREQEDEYLHKIIIAAATTLAMACFKPILVMFFVEQRVFLILNLLLLAIFLSSIRSTSTENQQINGNDKIKNQEKKIRKECDHMSTQDQDISKKEEEEIREEEEKEGEGEEEEKFNSLSKEELNERVEAFIAMFRQHLVSDARKTKNHFISRSAQTDMIFKFHKPSKFTSARHSFCV